MEQVGSFLCLGITTTKHNNKSGRRAKNQCFLNLKRQENLGSSEGKIRIANEKQQLHPLFEPEAAVDIKIPPMNRLFRVYGLQKNSQVPT